MALFLVSAPPAEPLSLEEVKLHCQINAGDDLELHAFIQSARLYVENFTERKLITQTWDQKLTGFPCGIWTLPFAPVSSITSISYLDGAGNSQTWDSADYQTELPSGPWAGPARIHPAYNEVYPVTRTGVFNAVTCRFVAGYGAGAPDVPQAIRTAMLMLIRHWHEQREAVNVGNLVTTIDLGVNELLWPFKLFPAEAA